MNPQITEGSKINYFGIQSTVVEVEPYSDYMWSVTLEAVNDGGGTERFTAYVPTDYDTVTGMNVWTDKHIDN